MNPVRDHRRRLPGRRSGAILLGIALILPAAQALAADSPVLVLEAPALEEGHLLVGYRLTGLFDDEIESSLESGLPATLVFRWRLWRQRNGWPDRRLATGGTLHRVYYDVLEDRYEVFNDAGRSVASCADVSEVESLLCGKGELVVDTPAPLRAGRIYFIELEVLLEPVDSDEIRGLEDWLSGTREGEKGRRVFSGVSRYAEGFLRRMAGLGSRSAWARSETFHGDG